MKTSVYENDLQSLQFKLPFRTDAGHKGDFGRCVVVGGSENYVGAPRFAAESAAEVLALTAEAAMRSGCGTSVLGVPDFLAEALYSVVRYSAVFPLPSVSPSVPVVSFWYSAFGAKVDMTSSGFAVWNFT